MSLSSSQSHFSVHVKSRPDPTKVLFYFTSYKMPWWIFIIPIVRFNRLGYEVVVYSLHDEVMENEDPSILPGVTSAIIDDVTRRREQYAKRGIKTFHGIGNSLGSYMMFNCSLRIPFAAIVLNSVGSAADVLFSTNHRHLKKTTSAYKKQHYTQEKLYELWKEFDTPSNGHAIKSPKILVTYSLGDTLVPPRGSIELIKALEKHDKKYEARVDHLPHEASIFLNSLKVKDLYKFLNS